MGNSVIYRPAYDAEVEYLEGTETQWIDTGVYPNSATSFELKETLVSGRFMFGCWDNDVDNAIAYIITGEASVTGILFYRNAGTINNTVLNYDCGGLHIYSFRNKKLYIDNVEINDLPIQTDTERLEHSIYLFNRNANGGPTLEQPTNARIHSFQVTEDGVLIRDFIPVRIGSIGYMYDKVTKQLFANKGTGQFILGNDVVNAVIPQQRCVLYFGNQRSVGFERIYEEYEWLGTGSGSPNIRLQQGYNTDENAFIETTYKCQYQNPNVDMVIGFGITGSNAGIRVFNASSSVVVIDVHRRTNGTHTAKRIYGHNGQIGVPRYLYVSLTEYRVDDISGSITLNENFDENADVGASSIYTNDYSNDVWYKETKLRANNITYDLIPCKLLQSIPAILDGNGIARQAGECGMWDKVSNKFYGNVANSGTFTVKGPKCYEEYKWLVANGDDLQSSGPQNVALFSFPSDMNLVGKTVQLTMGAPCRDIYVYRYVGAGLYLVLYVWNRNVGINSNNQPILYSPLVSQEPMVLDFENNLVSYNGQQIQIAGNSFYIYFPSAAIEGKRKYGRIYCQGLFDFTPCKLTHGIPASMDANGIARPAGTCGMWDKVNDKFYGNVANSGTFTVSND